MQVGSKGARTPEGSGQGPRASNDPENFGRVAKIFIDAQENEAYLADGYQNRRVVVLDADTGETSSRGPQLGADAPD